MPGQAALHPLSSSAPMLNQRPQALGVQPQNDSDDIHGQHPQMMPNYTGIGSPTIPVHNTPSIREMNVMAEIILEGVSGFDINDAAVLKLDLRDLQARLQRASSKIDGLLEPGPRSGALQCKKDKQFRCILCRNSTLCKNKGTFTRHLKYKHECSNLEYRCDQCIRQHINGVFVTTRKDKLHEHRRLKHGLEPLDREQITWVAIIRPQPTSCPHCRKPVSSWDQLIDCLCKHSSISTEIDWESAYGADDHEDGNDGAGDHDFTPPDSGNHGNEHDLNSFQSNENRDHSTGTGNSTFYYHQQGTNGWHAASDQTNSEVFSSNSVLPELASPIETSSIQEHNGILASGQDVSTTSRNFHSPLRSPITEKPQGSQLVDRPKPHGKESLPKNDEERPRRKTCEVCEHVLDDCSICDKLDRASTSCHKCADAVCQKVPIGGCPTLEQIRLPYRDLDGKQPSQDGSQDMKPIHQAQPGFNPLATPGSTEARLSQITRFEWFVRKQGDESTREDADEKSDLLTKVVSAMDKNLSREFQRVRFFEHHVYATQVNGFALSCSRETLIISEPQSFLISSVQEIVYQNVSLKSETRPVPACYHLWYLAQEKDHKKSEANLELARQASIKRRAHLRVRIRAIAGVLALRAAVSKSHPAADKTDIGDGWEIGIPISPSANHDDVVILLTWLVHFLIIILRIPPNPQISVMLTGGDFGRARLT
ncbi:hypothetical protein BJX99DRAFT_30163 [Aspergillus californicus]